MKVFPQRASFYPQNFQPKLSFFPPKKTLINLKIISHKSKKGPEKGKFSSFKPLILEQDKLGYPLIDIAYYCYYYLITNYYY